MTTQTADATQTAASREAEAWRHLDPLSAEMVARRLRNRAIAGLLRKLGKSLVASIVKRFRDRAVYQALSDLPDHLLNDIGVRRDQVSAIAYLGMTRPASDLALAASERALSAVEYGPAPVAAAPRNDTAAVGKPLAA